jgi:hypothetical protein
MIYSIYAMISFKIKNQKDKEHFFIFRIKKKRMFYGENLYLKKIPTRDTVTPISRVLKRVKLAGVSQYPAWVLYLGQLVM